MEKVLVEPVDKSLNPYCVANACYFSYSAGKTNTKKGSMKTIVSVTPIRVEADSRTFKEAASMKRFGFHSIVVEGEPSQLSLSDLPFELRPMVNYHNQHLPLLSYSPLGHSVKEVSTRIRKILKSVNKIVPLSTKEFVDFLKFVKIYFINSFLIPLGSIPKASLYYMHSPVLFPAVYCLSRRYKVPFIYDAHDFYSGIEKRHDRSQIEKRWIDPFYKKIERICIRHAAAVVTTSEGFARLQEHAFGVRSIVIRNCEDSRLVKKPSQDLRQQIGVSWNDFLIVTIGQAKKGMAIRESIEALAILPPRVHLALVGRYYEQYLEYIRLFNLENRVHLVQPVKPFEVTSFVKSANVSLIPYYPRSVNYKYFLPNGFFQSIAAELPILYPELPEMKRFAESHKLGIPINPKSPITIREAVLTLMNNDELRSIYKRNLKLVNQSLNWEKEEVILYNLIFSVLNLHTRKKF
jgi:glycosyltransferase involved in cell wall biosynthesis